MQLAYVDGARSDVALLSEAGVWTWEALKGKCRCPEDHGLHQAVGAAGNNVTSAEFYWALNTVKSRAFVAGEAGASH